MARLIAATAVGPKEIDEAKTRLLAGDVVVIPTETVYGLAAAISSEEGLKKIFSLKERPFFDPLIVHISSFKEAASVVKEWPPLADFIARFFWPGPLTLVLPKADHIHPLITSGLETVAIRYPNHPIAQKLIQVVGSPLAAPSANKFGKTSPSCATHARNEFPDRSLLILDGGPCEIGIESTVISFGKNSSGHDELLILRPGGITEEMLQSALERWSHPVTMRRAVSSESPGHMKHHYMPVIPLVILKKDEPIGLSESTKNRIKEDLQIEDFSNIGYLDLSDEPALAARHLYSQLREISDSGAKFIVVRKNPDQIKDGLWQAIWDRLSRAASLDLSTPPEPGQ